MAEEKKGVSPMFDIIAIKDMKSKKKEGSLDDLLKCVSNLSSSTESLRDYGVVVSEEGDKKKIEMYLNGLLKIQDGLLEMAQQSIASRGTMQPVEELAINRIAPGME